MYPPLVITLLIFAFGTSVIFKDNIQLQIDRLSSSVTKRPLSLKQVNRRWSLESGDFAYLDKCMENNEEIDVVYLAVPDGDKHLYEKGVYRIEKSGRTFVGASLWDKASSKERVELLNQFIDSMGLLAEDYIKSKSLLSETLESTRKKHARQLGSRLEAHNLSKELSASSTGSDWDERYDSVGSGQGQA